MAIQATLRDIEASSNEALINAEKLTDERRQALDLALKNEKSWLKEKHQYRSELAKLMKKSYEDKSQTEHIKQLVAGLSSMNKSQEKLQRSVDK